MTILFELILIFILSFILIRTVRTYGTRFGLVDIPNKRSSHAEHKPTGGGIGFYLGVSLIISFFHFDILVNYTWTLFAIFLVFFIGFLDDHHDTTPNTKFIIIFIGTVFLFLDGLVIDDLGTFFGISLSLGWLALPFTIFAASGFTNALNLIDGLDGLSSTISIVILSALLYVGYTNNDMFIIILSAGFIASVLAFLFYNWSPASIFMGDSGALTLGFVISVLAIKSLDYISAVSILFIAAVPILDTAIVMTRRKINGRCIFCADRCHIHHIMRHFFAEDTQKTVLFLGILQGVFSLTGLLLQTSIDEGFILILFILNIVMLYMFLSAMIKRQKRNC